MPVQYAVIFSTDDTEGKLRVVPASFSPSAGILTESIFCDMIKEGGFRYE